MGYLVHSSGPWKKHKYIKKVGDRYYYTDGLRQEHFIDMQNRAEQKIVREAAFNRNTAVMKAKSLMKDGKIDEAQEYIDKALKEQAKVGYKNGQVAGESWYRKGYGVTYPSDLQKIGTTIPSILFLAGINAGSKAKDLATDAGIKVVSKGKDFVNSLKSKFSK